MPSPNIPSDHVITEMPSPDGNATNREGEPSDWERARPHKRKRVALACSLCRERKVKYDGAKPVCTPCNKRGSLAADCAYTILSHSAKQTSERDDGTHAISAMGATVITQNHHQTPRSNVYYGASSLVSLIQGVTQPAQSGSIRHEPASAKRHNSARGDSSLTSLPMLCMLRPQYALPPRKIADDLLRLYFDNNHIFYPWTHSQSFRKRYEALWETGDSQVPDDSCFDVGLGGNNCPPNIFVCALNAMFALGCQFSDYPSADKDSASATFCERISGLLQFDLLDHGSIATVQALLLFGLYLQCTNYPERCWNIIGLAQRMAIGLGLQTATPLDDAPPLEIAIRRRVWHACVQMDITVCMTLGRPSTLRIAEDVPMSLAIDEEYLPQADTPPFSDPPISTFFIQNTEAARLLGRILDQVYHPSLNTPRNGTSPTQPLKPETLSAILKLHSELDKFSSSSSNALQDSHDEADDENIILKRQRNVLHSRVLHMRVLLHRPCFTKFCSLSRSQSKMLQSNRDAEGQEITLRDSLQDSMVEQCALVCVKTACELAMSLKRATIDGATGAWWYAVFYITTCAVIIVLTESTPSLARHLVAEELDRAWRDCLETLTRMNTSHALAGQYMNSLKALRQRSQATQGDSTFPTQRDVGVAQSDHPLSASAYGTVGSPTRSQNPAHHQADMPGGEDSFFYPSELADGNETFFPALLGDWEADINSIINIV
ncbi:hypothetical protein Q7P37_003596 [Cladosporium fusiforme]